MQTASIRLCAFACAVVAGIASLGSASGETEKERRRRNAADAAEAAHRTGDEARLRAIAEAEEPDAWLVARDLLARGEPEAAQALARASGHPDVRALSAFVAAQRARALDDHFYEVLREIQAAVDANELPRALRLAEAAKGQDPVSEVLIARSKGIVLHAMGRMRECSDVMVAAAGSARAVGWLRRESELESFAADSADEAGLHDRAVAAWRRRAEVDERRGNLVRLESALFHLGKSLLAAGRPAEAVAPLERALGLARAGGNPTRSLLALGNALRDADRTPEALDRHREALRISRETGEREAEAVALDSLALDHRARFEWQAAVEHGEEAVRVAEELEDDQKLAAALVNLGTVRLAFGESRRALEVMRRAVEIAARAKSPALDRVLNSLGSCCLEVGDYAAGLEALEQALALRTEAGDVPGQASSLNNLSAAYGLLGDHLRARELAERAGRLFEQLGDRPGMARAFLNLGAQQGGLGAPDQARAAFERAAAVFRELGDPTGEAKAKRNLAAVALQQRDFNAALEHLAELGREVADDAPMTALLRGGALVGLGNLPAAVRDLESGWNSAEQLGQVRLVPAFARELASARLAQGDARGALDAARRGVDALNRTTRGLGDEQGVTAREREFGVFEVGLKAARVLGRMDQALFFIEAGRSTALLEALGTREALCDYVLPEELRTAEATARAAEAAASQKRRAAVAGGGREALRRATEELESSRRRLLDVIESIQREEKSAANLVYPVPDTLPTVQARLRDDEAMVLYTIHSDALIAMVITRDGARLVDLAGVDEIAEVRRSTNGLLLRKTLIDPLRLPGSVRRLQISPVGWLSGVAFGVLALEYEVSLLPSATVHGVLLADHEPRGSGVLALGDPDYSAPAASGLARPRGRDRLSRLPASRDEAKAVGDVLLLGPDATEERLRLALASRERWRAVHLACHGLLDPVRPGLSALALSGGDLLTGLELWGERIPADLVVLSACESARGKDYFGEGTIGFVRALFHAGAARVVVSTREVDDDATRALMTKFYELWNPRDGGPGLPAVVALRRAQDHVRGMPEWSAPGYWASWQLWGLPD